MLRSGFEVATGQRRPSIVIGEVVGILLLLLLLILGGIGVFIVAVHVAGLVLCLALLLRVRWEAKVACVVVLTLAVAVAVATRVGVLGLVVAGGWGLRAAFIAAFIASFGGFGELVHSIETTAGHYSCLDETHCWRG